MYRIQLHRPATRILIVDDNRDACDSIASLLQTCGHDVKCIGPILTIVPVFDMFNRI